MAWPSVVILKVDGYSVLAIKAIGDAQISGHRDGWSVIVDATFFKRAERDAFAQFAKDTRAVFSFLAPGATAALLHARILARGASGHDASEATLEVLTRQMQTVEPLDADALLSVVE